MKKTILILAILLMFGVDSAFSQVKVESFYKTLTVMTKRGKAGDALTVNLGDGSPTFYWKIWASPKYWSPIDTSSEFLMSELVPGDTVVVPFIASDATTSYNAAVKLQWGNGTSGVTVWKPPITLDSMVKVGSILAAVAASETTADSILVGRNVYHDWMASGKGSDRFRLLIAKDTTDAAVTDLGTTNGTGTFRLGVLRRTVKGKF